MVPDAPDPFERLQKWVVWLFGLHTILGTLIVGFGKLVMTPVGISALFAATTALLFGLGLALAACAYGIATAEVQVTTLEGTQWVVRLSEENQRQLAWKKKLVFGATLALAGALMLAGATPLVHMAGQAGVAGEVGPFASGLLAGLLLGLLLWAVLYLRARAVK